DVTAGNSPAFNPVTADSRKDLLVLNSSGALEVIEGTQSATPAAPTYPSDKLVIAEVLINELTTALINDADITDVRPFLNLGGGTSTATDGAYVNVTGDTMTGTLTLSPASDNALVTTAGNVGIGTAGPKATLDVAGNIILSSVGGKIYGTNIAAYNAYIQPYTGSGETIITNTYNDGGAIIFKTLTTETQRMRIQYNGNIGIGPDTTPDYLLDVQGTLHADGDTTIDGNVGIGTTSPTAKLEVAGGDISIDNTKKVNLEGSAGDTYIYRTADNRVVLSLDGIEVADWVTK
ncbi:hypothetical protein KJ969_05260, partial [Patescibacteria group bacterium]|nr:hypothetical protein [Patescibacteria group bacterium]